MILPGDLDNNLLCFESGQGYYTVYSSIPKRDSVILTFDVPLVARGWSLEFPIWNINTITFRLFFKSNGPLEMGELELLI